MTRARFSRTWLWLLLAAALFTRAVLPQGYMPERSGSGAVEIKICGTHGVWRVPLEKGARHGDDKQHADQTCAFAGFATAAPPPAVPSLPLPTAISLAFAELPNAVQPRGVPRFLPPATGPPLPA